MSGLAQAVEDYLAIRRALGFKLRAHGPMLLNFVEHLDKAGASSITAELALAWATGPIGAQPSWWGARLGVVRAFARYLHSLDPSVQVPSRDLLSCRRERPRPYLYCESDISRLLAGAATLRPALRARTYRTFFGLLAVTGMRVGEAIRLDRDDVDLAQGLIVVRQTKFGKSRELPLHPSTLSALERYARERDRLCRPPKAPSFFISTVGTRLQDCSVHVVFAQLVERAGLRPRAGSGRPRIHGLRHSFAVASVGDWYRDDLDVAARMPLLSAYLGHASPASTYWYLQAAPELLGLAARRLERVQGGQR